MIKLKDILFEQKMLTIYRGISVHNRDGNYFTTNPEWARQFTQSGQDKEIFQVEIDPAIILKPSPLPQATNDKEVNAAIEQAKAKGFAAVWVDEGVDEPNSIFVIRKGKLRNVKRYGATLDEAKKLNMDNVEDAAEYLIRQTWKRMPSSDDRFSEYQVALWLDNDQELSDMQWELSQKFFPEEGDRSIDKFIDVMNTKLEELEKEKQSRLAKKVNTLDPLFVLKKLVRGKKWEGAKQALINNALNAWGYRGGKVTDEEAEAAFNRMYKNAMGETVYDEKRANEYGRLSDMRWKTITGNNHEDIHNYSNNIFLDQYAGWKAEKFGDKVKVYRGVNNPTVAIRPGDYVTFDKDYAKSYARGKFGVTVSDVLNSKDLYVYKIEPNNSELVYWPEGHQIKKYEGHIPTFREFWTEVNQW